MEAGRQWEHTVTQKEDGKTLEQILKAGGFSKKEISRLKFRPLGMTVDGEKRRSTDILRTGQRIALRLGEEALGESLPGKTASAGEDLRERQPEGAAAKSAFAPAEGISASSLLVYEDEDLLIANKPSGLSCHPGRGHYQENLGGVLSAYCREKGEPCRIRLIGRLDLHTSGAVVFAKNQAAAARLWAQRERGEFQKRYLAAVHGHFRGEGTISLPLGPARGEKNRMEVRGDGQRAVTRYRCLGNTVLRGMPVSFLECSLETGRTHQIRAHLSALGHPVLGDPFYGVPDGERALALHAYYVTLLRPFGRERIERRLPPGTDSVLAWALCSFGPGELPGSSPEQGAEDVRGQIPETESYKILSKSSQNP